MGRQLLFSIASLLATTSRSSLSYTTTTPSPCRPIPTQLRAPSADRPNDAAVASRPPNDDDDVPSDGGRRSVFLGGARAAASALLLGCSVAGGAAVPPARAGLLDDFGSDPNVNKQPEAKKEQAVNKGKEASNLEPNLRSNYYYPTNKVRYLPRIKKCSDAIPLVAMSIGAEDWDAVRNFATVVADDTILPMKLYVSSLGGGGTNVKVGFAKEMEVAAKKFEKSQKELIKASDKRDAGKTSAALESMAEAMLAYRTSGRLLGPDGGGDIPSVDEIRRATKRFRGDGFEAKVKDRDERLRQATAAQ